MTQPKCPHLSTCAMALAFRNHGSMGVWKALFCEDEFGGCARFRLSRDGREVPLTLMPNGAVLRPKDGRGP